MNLSDTPDPVRARPDEAAGAADAEAAAAQAAVRAVRQGDTNAFAWLVERYQRRLFGFALMLTREPAAADEVAQDAFVRAFVHLGAYDARRPFYPWLATIAVRLAQNWLSRRARATAREGGAPAPDFEDVTRADPLAALIADEQGRRLWRDVAALPSGERTAAILYYQQELSSREIAHALGVTTGTVKTLLFRARRRLRRTADTSQQERNDR